MYIYDVEPSASGTHCENVVAELHANDPTVQGPARDVETGAALLVVVAKEADEAAGLLAGCVVLG